MKKAAGILGLVLAVVFLILGFTTAAPDKYIKSYGTGKMTEYVGGDAYNFIIEASLRGGEISGALTAKAIYYSSASILAVISLFFLGSSCDEETARKKFAGIKQKFSKAGQNFHSPEAENKNPMMDTPHIQAADTPAAPDEKNEPDDSDETAEDAGAGEIPDGEPEDPVPDTKAPEPGAQTNSPS